VTANNGTKNAGLPNYDMDFPLIASAGLSGTSLALSGYVGSAPNQTTFGNAAWSFFKSDKDTSGYGEGQSYLGYLTTDANGNFLDTLTVSGLIGGRQDYCYRNRFFRQHLRIRRQCPRELHSHSGHGCQRRAINYHGHVYQLERAGR